MEKKIVKGENRYYFFSLLLIGSLAVLPMKTSAQSLMDNLAAMEIGRYAGSNIQGAISAAGEMRSLGGAASTEIDEARRQYWQAVKSGKNLQAAGDAFRRQLWAKDLYYLMMSIPEGVSGPRATVLHFISGGIDGGIRPEARPFFEIWVKSIREHLGAESRFSREENHQFLLPSLSVLSEAMEAARKEQAEYIRVRDWAEIDASGLSFPWDTDAQSHILMIMTRYTPKNTPEEIEQNYLELVDLFGEKEVLAAGEKIRLAPRDSKGKIANPAALNINSNSPASAFIELLATVDGLTYFKYLLWQGGNSPANAQKLFDLHTYIFDPAHIEIAANKVLNAPKAYGNILTVDARSELGVTEMNLVPAIQALSANGDPLGEVKILVARGINCTSEEQFKKVFSELLKKHGQEKILRTHKAYFKHQEYQSAYNMARRTPEQEERALAIQKEFEGKGLSEEQQQYHLLMKALDKGIWEVYALGFPGE